jgi:uncharacterized membrane protein
MIENLEPILTAAFAGILYAAIWWAAKNVDPTKPSPTFDWGSLLATVAVGLAVGVTAVLTDAPITQMSVEAQIVSQGAIIAVIEKSLKTLYRYVTVKKEE